MTALIRKTPGTISKFLSPASTGIKSPQANANINTTVSKFSVGQQAVIKKANQTLTPITGALPRGPKLAGMDKVTPESYSNFQKDIQLEEMFGQYGSIIAPKIRQQLTENASIGKLIAEANKKLGIRQERPLGVAAFEYDKQLYDKEGNIVINTTAPKAVTSIGQTQVPQLEKVDPTKPYSYSYSQNRTQKAIVDLSVAIRQGRQAALRYPTELKPLIPVGMNISIKR